MKTEPQIAIGIVTFNNLAIIQECFPSWRAVSNAHLVIFDNGSNADVVAWLRRQQIDRLITAPKNLGAWVARNRIIEYCRDREISPYVLLADSDVKFNDGMTESMLKVIESDPQIGFVGYEQAIQHFSIGSDGTTEEVASECQLTRLKMWLEIGGFPETLKYYSGDSWKSTIANMHGWKTRTIRGEKGYHHFRHSSQTNAGVKEQMVLDAMLWEQKEAQFCSYWRTRILLGKGNQYRQKAVSEDSDKNVHEKPFIAEEANVECLLPSRIGFRFTQQLDVEALVMLARQTVGGILEVGCHEGTTTMQFAYNFPNRMVYGVDYCGVRKDLNEEQAQEQVREEEIGCKVRAFRNVLIFNQLFEEFDMKMLADVGFVFYDADLTYSGIKSATEKVLEYFYSHPSPSNRILAWHDYVPKRHINTHPEWLRVGEYVRKEVAHVYAVNHLHYTNVAYMVYPGGV